jgi:O-antigen ligase
MSQKNYLLILRGGVYFSFLVLYLVFNNLLFPYITSKQISFNIIIEILFVFWLAFIIKYPNWRPARSWITYGLAAFFATLLLSSFTGVDFNLSFWGDIERMLGVFHLLHFLAFYLVIITVMREWKDWRNLLMVSVAAAAIESLFVFFQNSYGTFGNTSYISGYMIFNIYFALILFFRQKNWGLRSFYAVAIIMMLSAMKIASTRGAYVGLALSILLLFFLLAVFNKNKKLKFGSMAAAVVFVLFIVSIYTSAQSDWVKNNGVFTRIAQINFGASTFQTRLISWKTALTDFPRHPILGTGYGNFAITFDKYFDPKFYDYTRGETYFDHAHNNVVDIASTTGLVGLAAYLSIFVAVFYYLIRGYRQNKFGLVEFIFLTCVIVAYFIQNIVLFDSLVTYFSLMIMLGFIYWLVSEENKKESDEPFTNREFYVLVFAGAAMLFVLFQYNYQVYKMLNGTIEGQVQAARYNDLPAAVSAYKKALSIDTPLDRDSRASLGQLILGQANALYSMDKNKANEILDYTIGEQKKNVALGPGDSFMQMTLAQVLNLAASVNGANPEKFSYYSGQAEEAINKSIAASPGRVPIYFIKAQIFLTRGETDKAIEILKYAISLNSVYPDGYCQLARVYFYFQKNDLAYENMNGCVDYGGLTNINSSQQFQDLVSHYTAAKDWSRLIVVYQYLSSQQPNEAKIYAALANAYLQNGQKDEAIKAAEQAAQIDPKFKQSAEEFIRKINNSSGLK